MASPIVSEITPGISYKVSGAVRVRADLQLNLIITGDAIFDVRYPAVNTPAFTLIQGSNSVTLAAPVNSEQSSKEIPNRIVLWNTSDSAGVRNLHVRILDPTFITPSEIWTLRAIGLSTDSSYALVMDLHARVLSIDVDPPEGRFPDTPENMVPIIPGSIAGESFVDTPGSGLFFDPSGLNIFYDSSNNFEAVVVSASDEFGINNQVFLARVPLINPDSTALTPRQLTSSTGKSPCSVHLPNGEIFVVYQRQKLTGAFEINQNICFKRAPLDDLAVTIKEMDVDVTEDLDKINPFAVAAGNRVVILWTEAPTGNVRFNRFDLASGGFTDPIQVLSATHATRGTGVHAAVDAAGATWIAYPTPANMHVVQLPPSGAAAREVDMFSIATPNLAQPLVIMDQNRNMWFFWTHIDGPLARVEYRRFVNGRAQWDPPLSNPPLTVSGTESGVNILTSAVPEPDGSLWAFMHAARGRDVVSHIFAVRFDSDLEEWGPMHQLTDSTNFDVFPQAVRGPDEAFWLVWKRIFGGNDRILSSRILHRRLITQS